MSEGKRLEPESSQPSTWDALVASGRVKLPTETGALTIPPAPSGITTADLLDELRRDQTPSAGDRD